MSDHSGSGSLHLRESLSPREQQLLDFAVEGYTDQAIANKLGISLATVGTYWGRVRIKFGPYNRTELVALYLKEEAAQTLSLLREENQDLVAQIEAHAKNEEALKSSLELFRGLVETAPDAILLVTGAGRIELANEQAAQMFGYAASELVGKMIESLVPERHRDQHRANRAEYNSHPTKRRMGEHASTVAVRKDGSEFSIAATLSAIDMPDNLLVTCIIRELTGRVPPL
jgi:PAS domain S-box-containing protein